jgi:hypothetical protein
LSRTNQHVYFIEGGVAAVLAVSRKVRIAIGLIGCEGATGIPVFLGDTISPHSTVMITDGSGYRVSVEDLRLHMKRQSALPDSSVARSSRPSAGLPPRLIVSVTISRRPSALRDARHLRPRVRCLRRLESFRPAHEYGSSTQASGPLPVR